MWTRYMSKLKKKQYLNVLIIHSFKKSIINSFLNVAPKTGLQSGKRLKFLVAKMP